MLTARRTEAAERDLQDIAFYVAFNEHRPQAAENLARLSKSAEMGASCPELGESVRLFSHKRWVIIFRYEAHGIDVLRFADSSQDYLAWRL